MSSNIGQPGADYVRFIAVPPLQRLKRMKDAYKYRQITESEEYGLFD